MLLRILRTCPNTVASAALKNSPGRCMVVLPCEFPFHIPCSTRSRIGKRTVPNLQNESAAALGYAESSWATVQKMINLFDEALGPSIPAYYLDIGSGSLAHCAIAASASGRFLVCDGIEYGSARFEASQKSLLSARKSGILKSPCKIVFGDVLTSRDIQLSAYNVYFTTFLFRQSVH